MTHNPPTRWALLLLLTTLVACGDSTPVAPPRPTGPQAPLAPTTLTEVERVALMERHYTTAIAAHDALIRGDLAALRARLGELASQELPANAPASWRPLDARLREAARSAAGATTLEAAGPAMGAVVEACGTCHASLGSGPAYRRPLPPEGTTQVAGTMLGHQWATERLWEGVTGPREEAWRRGAAAIAAQRVFADRADTSPALLEREAALQSAARTAMAITGLHERALAYGQLLGTCATCHREASIPFGTTEH